MIGLCAAPPILQAGRSAQRLAYAGLATGAATPKMFYHIRTEAKRRCDLGR